MRSVQLRNVTKSYNGELLLQNVNLTIPSGKFFALLGPSGCGKTTILRLIGGFERVDSGDILIGDRAVTHLPSNQRSVNTVFQSYALFPHLNVFDNIAYSLRVRGLKSDVIAQRVHKLVTAFGIEKHLNKSVRQLSGGQQQRVAVARAVINEPDVLLLDEPLAALDIRLRERMLMELMELQDLLKTTFVYVTHDPFEALTVSDQMAIMSVDGTIAQLGTPKEIYEFPVSSFVAEFVGATNILSGSLYYEQGKFYVRVADLGLFQVDISRQLSANLPWAVAGNHVLLNIRPEKITIAKNAPDGIVPQLQGRVENMVYYGHSTLYHIRVAQGHVIKVFMQNEHHIAEEIVNYYDEVCVFWHETSGVVFDR